MHVYNLFSFCGYVSWSSCLCTDLLFFRKYMLHYFLYVCDFCQEFFTCVSMFGNFLLSSVMVMVYASASSNLINPNRFQNSTVRSSIFELISKLSQGNWDDLSPKRRWWLLDGLLINLDCPCELNYCYMSFAIATAANYYSFSKVMLNLELGLNCTDNWINYKWWMLKRSGNWYLASP